MKIKVGVIFGGETVEHEISIISAVQAMQSMDEDKYEIIPIYITKDHIWYTGKMLKDIEVYKDFDSLKKYAKKVVLFKKENSFNLMSTGFFKRIINQLDIAFPIVHGNNAEDGTLQGYLDTLGIPYVGSHVLGSALGQDKVVMKQVMNEADIPIVDYVWFYDIEYISDKDSIIKKCNKLGFPLIVKPATLGSSVGITAARTKEDLDYAIKEAIKYDVKIVVEKMIDNLQEINCSVLGNYEYQQVSALEEVLGSKEILTYSDKYLGNGKGGKTKGMVATNRIIPAKINNKLEEEITKLAKETFKALNLNGVCRIDLLVDKKTKKAYVNEPNTIPGSLSFYLWEPVGKSYKELLDEMISLAIKDYKNRHKKVYSFETNILSNFNGLKGSKGKLKFKK